MTFNITGIHHIELTVTDLKKSGSFYNKLPNFRIVAKYPSFIMFYTGKFYLGLTDHKKKQKTKGFDEKNIGLDHVSFSVYSKKDLWSAISFFKQEKIKHGKIKKLSNNVYVLAFRDPDNIQLELCWKEK